MFSSPDWQGLFPYTHGALTRNNFVVGCKLWRYVRNVHRMENLLTVEKIRSNPVFYSILFGLILSFLLGGFTLFFQGLHEQVETFSLSIIFSAVNVVFVVFSAALLGVIIQGNGFKYIFKMRGTVKALIALLPVISFFVFSLLVNANSMIFSDTEGLSVFPIIAVSQITSAFVQNVLFRGLLVTALLAKFSSTKGGRVKSVFIASALYLIIYVPLNVISGGVEFMQIINTFVVGSGFCAAYLYSKNLLGLIAVQGIWMVLGSAITAFGTENHATFPPILGIAMLFILVMIVIFAVLFSRRAEPFVDNITSKY